MAGDPDACARAYRTAPTCALPADSATVIEMAARVTGARRTERRERAGALPVWDGYVEMTLDVFTRRVLAPAVDTANQTVQILPTRGANDSLYANDASR